MVIWGNKKPAIGTALALAKRGKKVTLVGTERTVGKDINPSFRWRYNIFLRQNGVVSYNDCDIEQVLDGQAILVTYDGHRVPVKCDTVVLGERDPNPALKRLPRRTPSSSTSSATPSFPAASRAPCTTATRPACVSDGRPRKRKDTPVAQVQDKAAEGVKQPKPFDAEMEIAKLWAKCQAAQDEIRRAFYTSREAGIHSAGDDADPTAIALKALGVPRPRRRQDVLPPAQPDQGQPGRADRPALVNSWRNQGAV